MLWQLYCKSNNETYLSLKFDIRSTFTEGMSDYIGQR